MTDHAGRYHAMQVEGTAFSPALQTTRALLQVLFLTVNMLTWHHRQASQPTLKQELKEHWRRAIAHLRPLIGATLKLYMTFHTAQAPD